MNISGRTKEEGRAEYWLDRAIELDASNATFYRNKGAVYQKRNEWLLALDSYRRAYELRPDVAVYRGAMATALYQTGDYAGAAAAFAEALQIDPSQRGWWIRLARARVHLGELVGAADAFGKALELQDDASTRSARDELMRQIRTGSRGASSSYYDTVFAESPKYAVDGTNSEYAPVWARVVAGLRQQGAQRILDLGCGPGQFAQYLAATFPEITYTGLDFSAVAVAKARQRCPQYLFEQRELPVTDFTNLPAFDTVVCTEVLEHVENDREILAALPAGTAISASVPNFDAFGHVRLFRDEAEVRARYGVLFDELTVEGFALSASNILWIMRGRRSAQALAADEDGGRGPVDRVLLGDHVVESVLWTDGTRYVEDFVGQFGLPCVSVAESAVLREPHVALRHDVDWSIENAFAMATLEYELGLRSTYFLLHPDGRITDRNYFGHIEGGQLVIDPRLFEWASRLIDLGHEVALHNDLISLALATRRQPAEFLEQIVEAFTRKGMPLAGSVAHGSRTCRELGYMNYQIFEELQHLHVAVDYQNSPELFDRFNEVRVVLDGHEVPKFNLRMADYGLKYEANFVPWEVYVSDSSAHWSVWRQRGSNPVELTRFERHQDGAEVRAHLGRLLHEKQPRSAVQCLIHACHWGPLLQFNAKSVAAVRKRRNQQFATRRCDARSTAHPAQCGGCRGHRALRRLRSAVQHQTAAVQRGQHGGPLRRDPGPGAGCRGAAAAGGGLRPGRLHRHDPRAVAPGQPGPRGARAGGGRLAGSHCHLCRSLPRHAVGIRQPRAFPGRPSAPRRRLRPGARQDRRDLHPHRGRGPRLLRGHGPADGPRRPVRLCGVAALLRGKPAQEELCGLEPPLDGAGGRALRADTQRRRRPARDARLLQARLPQGRLGRCPLNRRFHLGRGMTPEDTRCA